MSAALVDLPRFVLRDFVEEDRKPFLSYQTDPRYCSLYDFDAADVSRADRLFDLFRTWQWDEPRCNFQLGIFERSTGRLCGSAGLRKSQPNEAVLGIELCPDDWGRFRLALDVSAALIDFGFRSLNLAMITGDTSSGNSRVAKLALRFGATISSRRAGPQWMQDRGWEEVDWELSRNEWETRNDKPGIRP